MESFVFHPNKGEPLSVGFDIGSYANNHSLAIGMYAVKEGKPERYADVTVNLEENPPYYCAFIDVANTPELADFLEKSKIAYPTGLGTKSGFNKYPLYVFNVELLRRIDAIGLKGYERDNDLQIRSVPKDKIR